MPPNVNIAQLSHLICFYANADNLLNKRSEFKVALALHKPDVVCITEIAPKHCLTKVQQSELQVDGYDLCSNVHIHKRGVVIHSKMLKGASPCNFSNEFNENCWVEVKLRERDKLLSTDHQTVMKRIM